ncbi:MAG TPA: MotA/TolQ/ExbB proton channel family protein [Opitutaceae bacterium]|nr:MotA/TolQ/ExbB proton channel family protein [Opitutaceae bacterium]
MIQNLPLAFLMNKTPMELFHAGGYIMWPILITSLVGVTVVTERIIFTLREMKSRNPEVVEQMLEKVEAGDVDGAIALGRTTNDFIARIMVYSLTHRESSLQNAFIRSSSAELNRFGQGMPTLDTCITAAPYLGLIGTITGMMTTFGSMEGDISAAAAKITGGVAEALIATACGIAIAVIGLLPFNYLNARWENARHEVEDAGNALEIMIKKSSGVSSEH